MHYIYQDLSGNLHASPDRLIFYYYYLIFDKLCECTVGENCQEIIKFSYFLLYLIPLWESSQNIDAYP